MRADMSKVLVTRPRYGGGSKAKRKARRQRVKLEYDDDGQPYDANALPKRQKIRLGNLMDWDERKGLNEFLNPLWRFIRSRCGKPWDKVYSEICKNIRLDSAVQRHILQHLDDAVEKTVYHEDGAVFIQKWGQCRELWDGDFYVDAHGILREYKNNRRQKPRFKVSESVRQLVYRRRYLVQQDGIWFDVTVSRLPFETVASMRASDHDYAILQQVTTNFFFPYKKHPNTVRKQQLSKKDLKRYGLTNN